MRIAPWLAAIAICVATSAEATKPKHTPETPPEPPAATSSSNSASASNAQADSSSNAAANAHGGAGGSANSSSSTTSDASNGGVRIEHDVDALALSLPGQTAAPAVGGHPCLEHIRGGSGLSIGITGRTRFNDDCMELERARILIEAGRPDLAVELLYPDAPPEPAPAPSCEVQTERVFAECAAK